MKFIVNSQLLSKQLSSISGILSNNNTVPIINCFLFHVEGNTMTIRTTDLATTLTTTLPVDSAYTENLKEIAVPSTLLLNILKSLDDAPAIFDVDETNYSITITSGEGKYRLSGRNADNYPALPEIENANTISVSASVLVSAINKTSFATSSDEESHQQLSGIFCEIGLEHTTFVSTDGHKLVRYRRTDLLSDEPAGFILPRKPINIIKGILSSNKEDSDVTINYNSTNVAFTFGNHYAVCRLIDGNTPTMMPPSPRTIPTK
ncbi:MAG: DNA polymerase III subunit beta [Bacteroidales bacterium]|nr:DNA polymerase III subunit beta [Bacteroidales bacterium]